MPGEAFEANNSHKRFALLTKQCDHTLNEILKKLSSKTIIQECFPQETFGSHYVEIRDLLFEISELLRNLVKSEVADVMANDDLENKLNLLDEVIATAIAKQKEFKTLVDAEGLESQDVKTVLQEELINVQEMSTDDVIRFAEYCNMKNILGELIKRREFLDEVIAKFEFEVSESVKELHAKHDALQRVVKDNISKFEDDSRENSHNVDEMRKSLFEFVHSNLNFEEQDQDVEMQV